jgi:large subunit ribosomal protein L18
MIKTRTNLKFRRQRTGFTDYKKRLSLLKSGITRLVIRKSLKNMVVQLVNYDTNGDKVLVAVNSKSLDKYGWKYSKNSITACYLIGYLAGTLAKENKIKQTVADIGRVKSTKGSKVYAVIKGVIDAGVLINQSEDILPSEERIKGEHIANYAKELKANDKKAYEKKFSAYIKAKLSPEDIPKMFDEVKKKIAKK